MLKRMRNQFLPYNNIFGCDLSGGTNPPNFEGTLFRLPLRTKQQAIDSKIKSNPYCKDDMIRLLHLLKNCAGDLLTFTQNLKEIQLFHLPENSVNPAYDMQLIFGTEKAVIKTHPMFDNPADINVMTEVEKVCINEQPFTYTELISVTMNTSKNDLLDIEEACSTSSPWLVTWASATTPDCLKKAIHLEKEGALPLGSVAVSLKDIESPLTPVPFPHKEKMLGFFDKSHFFCFLPLPVGCKTPVHINGCFAVSSDRKGLMKSTSDEKGETEDQVWNRMLMSDAVCNANLYLLTSLEHFHVSLEEVYSSLWPISVDVSDEASCLSHAFCNAVVNEDYRVFYTPDGRRASFRESIFLDNTFRHDNTVGEFAFETFANLIKGEKVPMDMPQPLYHRFCTAGCEEQLVQQTMTIETFYKDIVFPNIQQIDEEKRDTLVMFILKSNDHSLQTLLKSTPCIPVLPDGQLRLPSDLVRPRSDVSELFCDEDGRFPNQRFCSETNLNTLVQLGMMYRTLPDDLVVERAKSISSLPESEQALRRCRRLLAYLCREKDNCQLIISDLSRTAFIPSLQKPSDWPLTWFSNANENEMFSPPNQMFFPDHMELVACSQLIVNVEKLKSEFDVMVVLKLLGVRQEVLQNDVEAQLYAIGQVTERLSDKQKSRLRAICLSVYEYLDFSTDNLARHYEDLPILWISDRLIPPSRATTETFSRIDCSPEIYQVVSDDIRFKTFLLRVGVRERLCKEHVILALERVQNDSGKTLESEKVNLIVNLLALLAAVCSRCGLSIPPNEKSRICVPDDRDVLRLVEEVCVDDDYPLPRKKYMYFVNAKVSGVIIKLLDIKSKRVKHLKKIKGSMPFGQKEELVTRLKGILEGYPRDETILYELLQNADDAGAKEIMFIQDNRQHQTERGIFGESWSDVQGPALCVFNDSCFSEEDLEGICNLGQGSKSQDPTKTGQFGVGFNAVYHLTDVPSFITKGPSTPNQGTFCAFDPNCTFCPVDDLDPGLRLPDLKELEETYPGVYECYLQKELPAKQGTWFRFPLRNSKMAALSRVCKTEIKQTTMNALLHQFQQNMKKCLLFLRSVRTISLCEIDYHGHNKVNHKVTSTLEENSEHELERFNSECDTLTKSLFAKSTSLQEIPKHTIQYIMTMREGLLQPERWIIAQTFGFDPKTKVPVSVIEAFGHGDIHLTPKGAVALPCKPAGVAGAYDCATQDVIHASSSSPAGSLDSSKVSDLNIFCFLPLPLKTGLPVHINGHFAVNQTRGSMWESETPRGYWNSLLFETAISNSYVLAIEYLRDTLLEDTTTVYLRDTLLGDTGGGHISDIENIKSSLKTYHYAFPRYNQGKTDLIKNMVSSFFVMLYERESTVFPVLSPITKPIWWVGLQQSGHGFPAFFDNLPDQLQAEAQKIIDEQRRYLVQQTDQSNKETKLHEAAIDAHQISNTLKDIGMKILESPLWIYDSMIQAFQKLNMFRINRAKDDIALEKAQHFLNPSLILRFLRRKCESSPDGCLLKDVDRDLKETPIKSMGNILCLVRYCLKDVETFILHMEQLPLLVTNDGMLRCFSATRPVFISEFCGLLPTSSEEFVHSNMVNLLQRIEKRGNFLKYLDLTSFARMLPGDVDVTSLSDQQPIPWDHGMLSVNWMKKFCRYLDTLPLTEVDISVLRNWCLIPGKLKITIDQDTEILAPCDKSFVLMDISSFTEEPLYKVLVSLQIPTPHSCTFSKTLRSLVASKQDPVRFVQSLHYHKDKVRCLDAPKCNDVLEYLSRSENLDRLNSSSFHQLKNLPLFTTVDGKTVELVTYTDIYIIENHRDLPTDGLDVWSNTRKITLLAYIFYTTDLMSYLKCSSSISIPELYCKHILPYFHDLDQKCHLRHLEYVRSILKDDPSCPLKASLKRSAFIFHEGVFKRADCFYSPHNRLCKKLCDQSMLPPYPFGEKEWKAFMVYAGMKTTVTAELYCQFARKLEQAGNAVVTEKLREQSKEMVTYLLGTDDELSNNYTLLEKIKNISFVVPYRVQEEDRQIYPQFGCEKLIPFCGSVPCSRARVVWTEMSILPDYYPHYHQTRDRLGILLTPPLSDVLSHAHNVCDTLNKRLHEQKANKKSSGYCPSESNITQLMTQIYTYLQDHCIDTSAKSEAKRMLSDTPLVHMKEMGIFVTAKQVSITFGGKKQIPPYLVEFPLHYGPYQELFQFLGATESVSLGQYSDVLYRIQVEVKSSILGPEQIQATLSALTGLMLLMEEADITSIEESMASVDTLYLPASDKTLAKSTDLVFANKKKLKTRVINGSDHRLVYLHSLKECNKNEDVVLKLPERLKPRLLSSIVQECLISGSHGELDAKVEDLRKFVASARFWKVIKKIGKFEDVECYRHRLSSIRFVSLSEIKTILLVDGRRIPGTEDTQECFYSEENGERKFYIAACTHSVRIWLRNIGQELYEMLSNCLEKRISPEKIRELIDYFDDSTRFKSYCEKFLDEEENEEDDSLSYHPGQLVPVGMHGLLENDIAILKVGDVVAYEKFDPAVDGDDNDDKISNDAVYIFVRILEEIPLADQHSLFQKYKVNFGQDNDQIVSGCRLYKVIYPGSSTTTELVLHTFGPDGTIPRDKGKLFDRLIDILSNAWKQDVKDRRRIVKRLLLAWHPDKNRDRGDEYESFCKEVTQYIFDIIGRLDNGERFDTVNSNESDGGNRRHRRYRRDRRDRDYNNWQYDGGYSSDWHTFGDRMSSRYTKNQRQSRHYFAQRREQHVPDPQPAEAKRWFRQASRDFRCGANSLEFNSTECNDDTKEDYNWICFKFHQACEKACKAYMYSIDAKKVTKYHCLTYIVPSQAGDELVAWLRDIETLVGSYARMRYPDVLEYPEIPGTMYTKNQADKLMGLAENVMDAIENLV